ncbi:hypothetical protein [Nostoc parmelioides]|uniref:Uncharacterized protein n=1 Tax=Nostoc parmelioides FACHB-3921 TaxID=2692909 RepID=A0ABR8BHH1_9NOSO|nr:hypothetical protein [Nostoc parmelioides]MBD2253323.1 hypothetical protein [Nostoc parmelioides FACHB-3921]
MKDMSILKKFDKLKILGLNILLESQDLEIDNKCILNNDCHCSQKIICTRIYNKNDKDIECFLFLFSVNDWKNVQTIFKDICSQGRFKIVNKTVTILHPDPPKTSPLPFDATEKLFDSGSREGININFKLRALSLIDELAKNRDYLMKFVAKNKSFETNVNSIIQEKLEYCLGLEKPPNLSGELIALQEIVESLFWYTYGEQGLEALITYIDPKMILPFNLLKTSNHIFSPIIGRDSREIYPKGIAPLITIDFLNRWGGSDDGLKSFFEVLSNHFANSFESPLEKKNEMSVKRMSNKYYPKGLSVKKSESKPQLSDNKSLENETRRKLIDIIEQLNFFRKHEDITNFLKLMNGINTNDFPDYSNSGNITKISITLLVYQLEKKKILEYFLRTLIEINVLSSLTHEDSTFILNLAKSVEPRSNGFSSAKDAKLVALLDQVMDESDLRSLTLKLNIGYETIEGRSTLWKIINLVNMMRKRKTVQELINEVKQVRENLINDLDNWSKIDNSQ